MSYKSTVFLYIYMKGFISYIFQIPKKIGRRRRDIQLQKYVKYGILEFLTEISYGDMLITVPSNLASGHYLYS